MVTCEHTRICFIRSRENALHLDDFMFVPFSPLYCVLSQELVWITQLNATASAKKHVYRYSKSNDGILQNLKELDYLLLSEKLPAALSFMQNDVMLWWNTLHAISIVCNTEILFLTLWLAAGLSRKTWIWSFYFSHFITIWFALFFANIRLSSLPLCHLYLESPRHYGEKCPTMEG